MQIRFVQTGGIGGVKLVADVDTTQLPPSETHAIEDLVDAALAERPQRGSPSRLRDDLQYEIQVTRAGTTESLRASDAEMTPSAAALIKSLSQRAQPSR
jgi:hypothetical protein